MKRFAAILLLGVAVLTAQTNRGAMSGTVTDQSGGVVVGAAVTIVNKGTNQTRKIVTAQNGTYTAADLEPVSYTVSTVENVKLDTAAVATVNVTLQTGSVDTKITLSAEAANRGSERGVDFAQYQSIRYH